MELQEKFHHKEDVLQTILTKNNSNMELSKVKTTTESFANIYDHIDI